MSTRLVNRESLALGLAELFLGDSATLIDETTRVLTSDDYFGAKTEVAVSSSREFARRTEANGNILYLMDHLLTRVDLTLTIKFLEIYAKTLALALGGDGTETDIMEAMINDPVDLRAELVFTYPNKVNQMILILPRVQIVTPDFELAFQPEDALSAPLTVRALRTDNANWSTRPIGKTIFV